MLIGLVSIREQTRLILFESTMNKSQRACVDDAYLTFNRHGRIIKVVFCDGNSIKLCVGTSNTSCNKMKVKKDKLLNIIAYIHCTDSFGLSTLANYGSN